MAHGTQSYFRQVGLLQRGLFKPNVVGVSLVAATSIGIAVAGSFLVVGNEGGKIRDGPEDKGK